MDNVEQLGDVEKGIRPNTLEEVSINENDIVYFGNRICPFAHRVWWTVLEKDIPIKYYHIDLGTRKQTWFKENINPFGTVPVIFNQGKPVFESQVIVEYLNELNPDKTNLYPTTDLFEKAAIRLFVGKIDFSSIYRLLNAKDEETVRTNIEPVNQQLDLLERLYREHGDENGPFYLGENLSLVEIMVMPHLDRFATLLSHFRNLNVFDGRERLKAAYDACKLRPAFQITSLAPDFIISVSSAKKF